MSGALHGVLASLAGAAKDAFFKYVTLLLPGNGTNGAQNNTFLDGSTNNFTVTRNGNPTQGTFSPYGANWSNYFDAVASRLLAPANAAFNFGTGDFTIELFANRTGAGTGDRFLIDQGNGAQYLLRWRAGTELQFLILAGGASFGYTWTFPIGVWFHIAVVRSGNNFTMYVDGTSVATMTNSSSIGSSVTSVGIGSQSTGIGDLFNGYISNLRVVKGTAVYTSNFTPPTAPLTAISGTSLLTCQSNRIIDNSTNAFAITRNGDVRVERFSPFAPGAAYNPAVIGGSGYFDGTGDYLTSAGNSIGAFGTGNFTVEYWIYYPSFQTNKTVIDCRNGTNSTTGYADYYTSAGKFVLYLNNSNIYTSTATVAINTWNHIAVCRTGTGANQTLVFINGVQDGTFTYSTNVTDTGCIIGSNQGDTAPINAYISNLRVVKGTAVYTANFTPPTSPLTAITNTSLLLNFTNAGIIDNAMMNDMETVGNAQISTTQSKWGGAALYFDGTGDALAVTGAHAAGLCNQLTASGRVNTVEMWLYVAAFTSPRAHLVGSWVATPSNAGWTYDVNTSGDIFVANNAAGNTITLSTKITTGAWQHLAFVNDGTNIVVYRNGTNVGSVAVQAPTSAITPLYVGQRSDGALPLNGYIDDLRITNGVARYTANFTAPAAAFPGS